MKIEFLKVAIGVVLSPLILLIILAITGLMDDTTNWGTAFSGFFNYVYPVGFAAVLVFGIPCYLLLRHFGFANYFTLAILGFTGGATIAVTATPILGSMLFFGGCGFLVSSAFWLLVIYLPEMFVINKNYNKSLQENASKAGASE